MKTGETDLPHDFSPPKEESDFPGGSDSKASACSAGDLDWIPRSGNTLERKMATHSSILAWRIPWTEEPGGLQFMESQKSRTRLSDFTLFFHFHTLEKEMATQSSVLALRIPGLGELGGLPSLGSHRVGHD